QKHGVCPGETRDTAWTILYVLEGDVLNELSGIVMVIRRMTAGGVIGAVGWTSCPSGRGRRGPRPVGVGRSEDPCSYSLPRPTPTRRTRSGRCWRGPASC